MPAAYQDFLGIGGSAPVVYAPGNEPNPKNPGGISNNALKKKKRDAEVAAEVKVREAKKAAETKARIDKRERAEREAAKLTWAGVKGDLKVLGPVALAAIATSLAVVATAGAVLAPLGISAAAAAAAAAAGEGAKLLNAAAKASQVAANAKKGNVADTLKGLASAGTSAASAAGVKLPPVASLPLVAQAKTVVDDVKKAVPKLPAIPSQAKALAASASATIKAAVPVGVSMPLSFKVPKVSAALKAAGIKAPAKATAAVKKVSKAASVVAQVKAAGVKLPTVKLPTATGTAMAKANIASLGMNGTTAAVLSIFKAKTPVSVAIAKPKPVAGAAVKPPLLPYGRLDPMLAASASTASALAKAKKDAVNNAAIVKAVAASKVPAVVQESGFFVISTGARRGVVEFRTGSQLAGTGK
jgi:hypothetical protein